MTYDKLVLHDDLGIKNSFSAKAASTISGGFWVNGSGTDVVGSDATAYVAGDLVVNLASGATGGASPYAIGIAEYTVTSGEYLSFITDGVVSLPIGSTAPDGIGGAFTFAGYGGAISGVSDHLFNKGTVWTTGTANTGFALCRLRA